MNHTIIYSNEKIISNDSQVSYLHAETLPNETTLDMIKREGLEHVHFVFDGHLEPSKVNQLVSSKVDYPYTIEAGDEAGGVEHISRETYVVTVKDFRNGLTKGDFVKLISGVHNSPVIGYHFSEGWSTVCHVGATRAEHLGIPTTYLELVE